MPGQILDVVVNPLYDTNSILTAGTTQLQFFTQPVGQGTSAWNAASSKTLSDTNLETAGALPAGQNFDVMSFNLLPAFSMTVADATLALQGAAFIFTIGSKDFLRIPARAIPAGMGPVTPTTTVASHGWQDIHNGFSIAKSSLNLAQMQNFSARLTWSLAVGVTTTITSGAAGLPITVMLGGFLKRLPQ